MSDKAITVIAKIVAKTDKIDEVKKELLGLIPPTRAEEGCIDYVLHQNLDNPAIFCFYENWKCKEDLDDHLQKPHLQAIGQKAEDLFAEPMDVQILKIVE